MPAKGRIMPVSSSAFPAPDTVHPLILPAPGSDGGTPHPGTVFLRAVIDHPRWEIGDYSYASSFAPPPKDGWAERLAPWLHPFSEERLVIGRFCQIADGVRFVTASANHRRDGISTYPFAIFQGRFDNGAPSLPPPGTLADTIIGHDVWIGAGAMVLPGARIGDGVIVGAGAVMGGAVPPYTVVGGNPARVLRHRFPPDVAARLSRIGWWHWPIDTILAHEAAICGADVAALEAVSRRMEQSQGQSPGQSGWRPQV
jgi:virginiamycin A acetyltransferase